MSKNIVTIHVYFRISKIYLIRRGDVFLKKYLLLLMVMLICLTGCGKKNKDDVIDEFVKDVETSKSYKLSGTMEISNGEEIYTYSIESNFLKDDYYKVILINQTNNHEQVILKNDDGLYVVTPSLNKSFKFDSIWPENSSQAYLLQNLVDDIKGDNEVTFEETEDGYIIKSGVNYPNNDELTYQKLYFDKDVNLQKVEVFNTDDIVKIKVEFKDINLRAKLSEKDFVLDDLIDTESNSAENSENTSETSENSIKNENTQSECTDSTCKNTNCMTDDCEEDTTTSSIDTVIYPLYIPSNTHLSNTDSVMTEDGGRVILSFSGDKNFVIVEETISKNDEFEIVPVFGDPLMLDDAIAAMSSNSISWNSDNMSYYLVSSDLSSDEMVNVARSLTGVKTVMSTK
jgi:outer membrane lipoprotein-sorting protein